MAKKWTDAVRWDKPPRYVLERTWQEEMEDGNYGLFSAFSESNDVIYLLATARDLIRHRDTLSVTVWDKKMGSEKPIWHHDRLDEFQGFE